MSAGAVAKVQDLDVLLQSAGALDKIAADCALPMLNSAAGRFVQAIRVSRGIEHLRLALTPEIMQPIMALQNTNLGFLTDQDPRNINKSTGKPNEPYPVAVVRECLIEAVLKGASPVGNEFNIISSRTYLTLNYFRRAMRQHPGLTDVLLTPSVPVMREGGAIVKYKVAWRFNGIANSIERDIPVRVNSGTGVDAILGKAERKIRAAAYAQITGSDHEEGETEALAELESADVAPTAAGSGAKPPGDLFDSKPATVPLGRETKVWAASIEPAIKVFGLNEVKRVAATVGVRDIYVAIEDMLVKVNGELERLATAGKA